MWKSFLRQRLKLLPKSYQPKVEHLNSVLKGTLYNVSQPDRVCMTCLHNSSECSQTTCRVVQRRLAI